MHTDLHTSTDLQTSKEFKRLDCLIHIANKSRYNQFNGQSTNNLTVNLLSSKPSLFSQARAVIIMGSSLPKGLRKEVLSPAAPGSRRVRRGDSVTVECQGSILGGPKFWSTKDPGQVPLTFPCGLGKVSPSVSDILMCGMIVYIICDFAIVCCVRCCIFNIRISPLSHLR